MKAGNATSIIRAIPSGLNRMESQQVYIRAWFEDRNVDRKKEGRKESCRRTGRKYVVLLSAGGLSRTGIQESIMSPHSQIKTVIVVPTIHRRCIVLSREYTIERVTISFFPCLLCFLLPVETPILDAAGSGFARPENISFVIGFHRGAIQVFPVASAVKTGPLKQ